MSEQENRLFVGNLSWGTTDEELRKAFDDGVDGQKVVEAKVIFDRNTGRSRGFGFVTYATDEEAALAREKMHNSEVGGRSIRVDKANTPQQRRSGYGGGGGGGYYRDNNYGGGGRDNYRDNNYQDNNYQDNGNFQGDNNY